MTYVEPNSPRWLSLEDLPNERWKDIEGYEGLYQISDYGRVKSLERRIDNTHMYRTRILKQSKDKDGYLTLHLSKNSKSKQIRVHVLVGDYFVSNPKNKPIYNHLLEVTPIYCNNHYTNLVPSTYSENIKYAYKRGRKKPCPNGTGKRGKDNACSVPVVQYDINGNVIKLWDSMQDITRALGFLHSNIVSCCKGRYKTAYGYKWRYYEEVKNDLEI